MLISTLCLKKYSSQILLGKYATEISHLTCLMYVSYLGKL